MVRALAILVVAIIAACASATTGNGEQDAQPQRFDAGDHVFDDAPRTQLDAPRALDASVPLDAPAPLDAGSGSGGQFCSVNMDCPDSGTCCFVAICVPGAGIGSDLCFPS
ncbi:MAG TPA: hypothetical protein VGF94_00640 [Kofleriaceae bacterium]|jgi:hypothetical protein